MADATETPTATEPANEVKIEDAGPAKKRLTITVPASVVDEKLDDSFSMLSQKAALPGFRPGHAPRRLIERRFGSNVRTETRNQLIADAYSRAIEENEIRVVGDPENDELENLELEPGKDFTFSIEVEVAPEFELPELEGVKIKKPMVEVTDQHIEDEIKRQSIRHGTPEEVEDGLKPGDRAVGQVVVTDKESGDTLEDRSDAVIALPEDESEPKGHVIGILVEDMIKLFGGAKVGDTVSFETTVSENDERPALRGRDVKIDYTITRAVRVLPASIEQVLEVYGMENEEELRTEIRNALDQRAEQEQRAAMREQVSEYLSESVDLELPEKLTARQVERHIERMRIEMLYRGTAPEEVETRLAEIRGESEAQAKDRLKLMFILSRLSQHYGVEVTEQEINGRVAQIAAQRGERPDQLRARMAQQGQLQQIALQIREHKALDRVIDTAEVEEITADEWNEYINERQAGSGTSDGAKKKKKKTSKKKTGKT